MIEEQQRNFGIDLFRVLAIGMVVLAQFIYMCPGMNPLVIQEASVLQFLGLETFFVLAGFLMFGTLFPLYLSDNFGRHSVSRYIRRRSLQIVPLYFLVLLLNLFLALAVNNSIAGNWKYFLFIQNFSGPMPLFFNESWGITIILFASILFPLVLVALHSLIKPKNRKVFFLRVGLVLTALFVLSKLIYHSINTNTTIDFWSASLKSVVIYRLDSVFIGILSGWLLHRFPDFFRRIKILALLAGIFGVIFLMVGVGYFQLLIENHPAFWNIFYLPLTSLIICCFLPVLYQWKFDSFKYKYEVTFASKITYAFYLLNCGMIVQFLRCYFSKSAMGIAKVCVFNLMYFLMIIVLATVANKYVQKRYSN